MLPKWLGVFTATLIGLATASLARANEEGTAEPGGSAGPETSAETEPPAGAAAEPVLTGPELAARIGYANAFGRIEPGRRIQSSVTSAVPFWLDAGYRFAPAWFIGAYGHYGLGIASRTSESECAGCQYSWVRFGLQVQFRFLDRGTHNLWVGLGAGREQFNVAIDEVSRRSESTSGWELVNAQFGAEWQPLPGLGLGPFWSFALGTYEQQIQRCARESECATSERNVEITLRDSGVHGWTTAGLRIVALP